MRRIRKPARSLSPAVARSRFKFGLARDTGAFDGSFGLVHDQYVWRRYMAPHPTGWRLSLHHSLPSTKVFVARSRGQVVGTMTLVQDSPIGLPMDEIYREELSRLRDRGRRLCEVSALAIDSEYRPAGVGILMRLVRILLIYAAELGQLDDLCIAVNPRHADFYLRTFRPSSRLGDVKQYQKVNGAPAVALRWDLNFVRGQSAVVRAGHPGPTELYHFFFSAVRFHRILARLHRDLPRSILSPQQFAHFFVGHDAYHRATPQERAFVESFYPSRTHERIHRYFARTSLFHRSRFSEPSRSFHASAVP